jgi:biotin transport system substrate-specific component
MADVMQETRSAGETQAVTSPWATRLAGVMLFAALTALGAYAEVPVPGSPVPVTLQTLVVSLSGVLLGARLGAASQAAYLLAGALGAPVFAGGALGFGYLLGPTGGYLLAFPLAAAVTGWLTAGTLLRPGLLNALKLGAGVLLGTGVIFAGGFAQLALLTGNATLALQLGVLPFLAGDVLKVIATTLIARRLGARARTLF